MNVKTEAVDKPNISISLSWKEAAALRSFLGTFSDGEYEEISGSDHEPNALFNLFDALDDVICHDFNETSRIGSEKAKK